MMVWDFVKLFHCWLKCWGGVLNLRLFFNIFNVTHTFVREMFNVYLDSWKNFKDHSRMSLFGVKKLILASALFSKTTLSPLCPPCLELAKYEYAIQKSWSKTLSFGLKKYAFSSNSLTLGK